MSERIPGFTSTGSKRPEALFGSGDAQLPARMLRASGCTVWDENSRPYTDYLMGLGATALGYAHPEVIAAVQSAAAAGVIGPLPPVAEAELAEELARAMPWLEQLRFLKTGAEGLAAAVRLARAHTGRDVVLGCGYHGWLDWCQLGDVQGVPAGAAIAGFLPFNHVDKGRELIRQVGDALAAVVIEPVVLAEPSREWLEMLRAETRRVGAVLVIDEVKTACRLAVGGATERYRLEPDLVVLGKAIASGFPLAVVGGRADIMREATRTWISSTLATESVSLAAARATLAIVQRDSVAAHLGRVGARLFAGLGALHARHGGSITGVGGIPEMCFLECRDDETSARLARQCARRGTLFKRSAYNFVSLAHDETTIDATLELLEEVLSGLD